MSMSLVDDARRLAAKDVVDLDCNCQFCGEIVAPNDPAECFTDHGELGHTPHAPDCPWLSMPRIVEALEAAEQVNRLTLARARGRAEGGCMIAPAPYRDLVPAKLYAALAAFRSGDFDQAETLYGDVLRDDPGTPDALGVLSLMCQKRGDHQLAPNLI